MGKHRRRRVASIVGSPALLSGQYRRLPGRIQHIPAIPSSPRAGLCFDVYPVRLTFIQLDLGHGTILNRIGSGLSAGFEQQLIEFGSAYLECEIRSFPERLAERKRIEFNGFFVRGEIRRELENPDIADLLQYPELLENWNIHRQQRLPDMESGMSILLEQGDIPASSAQHSGRGRASRAAADHGHVAVLDPVHKRMIVLE